jgi:hypothetical protein
MPFGKFEEFKPYDNGCFGGYIPAPVPGTEDGEDTAVAFNRAIVGYIAKYSDGIASAIRESLEMDHDDYAILLSGSVVNLARMDGNHCGYSLQFTICPKPPVRDKKDI